MAARGINHVTLAVHDLDASIGFYRDVLGCQVLATWPKGAYLSAGGTWLALVAGRHEREHVDDYSHLAFDVCPDDFDATVDRIRRAGCEVWQDNWTEGDSLYFRDPTGHRLEIHATTLAQRLASAASAPWEGLVITPEGAALAAGGDGDR
jgi:catechol 2,3-dioxygenase-like lactoylglutathione lyase family enzyme